MITTEVHIGSAAQQARISDNSSDLSELLNLFALKNSAFAAVVKLQLPLLNFIS
jgi:hypothetical protein